MNGDKLQIGDWVQSKEDGKYHKVLGVTKQSDNSIWIATDIGVMFDYMYEPIPLAKVHLTKNGFKAREETDDTEFYYYDCYEINVSFDEGLPEDDIPPIIFITIEFAEKSIAMPIEYLHELQNAMRLFDIEKEIVL